MGLLLVSIVLFLVGILTTLLSGWNAVGGCLGVIVDRQEWQVIHKEFRGCCDTVPHPDNQLDLTQ